MEIRIANKEDNIDAISRIYALSWKAAYKNIIPQSYLDELCEKQWLGFLLNNLSSNIVMIENGEYIGTSCICSARDKTMAGYGEIISIYLLPEYFGKGCGKALLNYTVSALKEAGYDKIYLWVLDDNLRARKFYEKNGFCLTSNVMKINIGGKELTEVKYLKFLSEN